AARARGRPVPGDPAARVGNRWSVRRGPRAPTRGLSFFRGTAGRARARLLGAWTGHCEWSPQPELLMALGCVSGGQETGRLLDVNGLHQYAFLPVGQVRLALA